MWFPDESREEVMKTLSPWKRKRDYVWPAGITTIRVGGFEEKFDSYTSPNIDLDIYTKSAALKVSKSVVSVVCNGDLGPEAFIGSGTIISCEDVDGVYVSKILTSGSIMGSSVRSTDDTKVVVYLSGGRLFEGQVIFYDCHYNISVIKIESNSPLPTASISLLDDSKMIDPHIFTPLRREGEGSILYQISPGDKVIGIGRYYKEDFGLMAAPGKFSVGACKFDCKELFRATFRISRCGIGGPLINRFGEVIGVNFFDKRCTPFLPINIALKCFEHFEKYGRYCRPWIGIEATNVYAKGLPAKEKIVQEGISIYRGVIVEKVIPESPSHCAGMLPNDVIVVCNGKCVRGFLEFFSMVCDIVALKKKKNRTLELIVQRGKRGACVTLTVAVDKVTPDKFYSWPMPEESWVRVRKYRKSE